MFKVTFFSKNSRPQLSYFFLGVCRVSQSMSVEYKKRFHIAVKTLQGNMLHFYVDTYSNYDGFVTFYDEKTQIRKSFHGSNCEITEVLQ